MISLLGLKNSSGLIQQGQFGAVTARHFIVIVQVYLGLKNNKYKHFSVL